MKEYSQNVALKGEQPQSLTLMYCTAAWCGPCKHFAPIMQQVADLHQGNVNTVKLNVDSHPEVAQQLGVRGVPTLVLINYVGVIDRFVGASPLSKINQWLAPHTKAH